VKEKSSADPVKIFKAAIDNIKPLVEVKSRRVGGASYQVPVDIRPVRRNALAIRWLVSFARGRSGKNMAERLAFEIIDAANGTGSAIKKKEETHRMAEANKAFAHYRW
jgi:small subunit ribosomal protein S7